MEQKWIKTIIICGCILIIALAFEHFSIAYANYTNIGAIQQENVALQKQLQDTVNQANAIITQLKGKQ